MKACNSAAGSVCQSRSHPLVSFSRKRKEPKRIVFTIFNEVTLYLLSKLG